jgi:hypothetical protein
VAAFKSRVVLTKAGETDQRDDRALATTLLMITAGDRSPLHLSTFISMLLHVQMWEKIAQC